MEDLYEVYDYFDYVPLQYWVSHLSTLYLDADNSYTSYAVTRSICSELYDIISSSDVRKGWWLDENGRSPLLEGEQYSGAREIIYGRPDYYKQYVNVKFGTADGTIEGVAAAAGDWTIMRAEELILLQAEALARAGKDGETVLTNFVRQYRDPQYNVNQHNLSLLDEIWWQRRVELWGEGFAYGDLMRLEKGVHRSYSTNWGESLRQDVEAGDERLVWQIPEKDTHYYGKLLYIYQTRLNNQKWIWHNYINDYDSISFGEAHEKTNILLYCESDYKAVTRTELQDGFSFYITLVRTHSYDWSNDVITVPITVKADDIFEYEIPSEFIFEDFIGETNFTVSVPGPVALGTYHFTMSIPKEFFVYPDPWGWGGSTGSSITFTLEVYYDEWEEYETKQGILFDGLIAGGYNTGLVGMYVDYKERKNDDGSVDYRLINPYNRVPTGSDEYGIYDAFPYVEYGEADEENKYYMDIHVSADGKAVFDKFDLGVTWDGAFSAMMAAEFWAERNGTDPDYETYGTGLYNADDNSITFAPRTTIFYIEGYGAYYGAEMIFRPDAEAYKLTVGN